MIVYITKYALSQGIFVRKAIRIDEDSNFLVVEEIGSPNNTGYYHNGEWTYSSEEAIKKFVEMREKKIKSLKKQIDKLKIMEPKIIK